MMNNITLHSSHTYYFIRYPLGAGGSHLSNILSLDPTFCPKIPGKSKQDNYKNLVNAYTNQLINSHLDNHLIINDSAWDSILENLDIDYPNSVHLAHAASIDWRAQYLEQIENKKFILLKFTTERSTDFVRARESNLFGTDTLANPYYREEIRNLYSKWILVPGKIDDDINFEIEIEDLLQNSIHDCVESLNKKFKLSIPTVESQNLHTLWINNLITSGLEKFIKI